MNVTGCKCKGTCNDPTTCACALRNGSDFPYVSQNGGRLVEAKDVVFECGPKCGCGPDCVNRTSQKGLRYRLEVFRTAKKGWAVRSWDFIPSGAPVCEYTGILARTEDMDSVLENNYIFEIDCLQTIKGLGGRERRSQNGDGGVPANLLDKYDQSSESAPEFCIDAGSTGNIARFINHCCEPNLFVQCVLSTHHDLKLARVMLFAADNIPPLQELTYDYGYELDSVLDSDGKIKQMPCYCGAVDCRK
ncbi:Histone-lysine N-methyltransferase, H3 lysine-9 specific SUVH4, partial [Mucuna pruriens]